MAYFFGKRTIPAGAGEPSPAEFAPLLGADYPRRRGGTIRDEVALAAPAGLSPQARGNLYHPGREVEVERTIPAGAGEPRSPRGLILGRRDYPRRRGGTAWNQDAAELAVGLSPQARGNPDHRDRDGRRRGTIPAGAGEPKHFHFLLSLVKDYPRRRGGTTHMTRRGEP